MLVPDRARVLREVAWKVGLVGAFVTATIQVAADSSMPGDLAAEISAAAAASDRGLSIRLGPPSTGPVTTGAGITTSVAGREQASTRESIDDAAIADERAPVTRLSGIVCPLSKSVRESQVAVGSPAPCASSSSDWASSDTEPDQAPVPNCAGAEWNEPTSGVTPENRGGSLLRRANAALPIAQARTIPIERPWLLGFGGLWLNGAFFGIYRMIRAHLTLEHRIRHRVELRSGAVRTTLSRLCRQAGVRPTVRLTDCASIPGPMAIGLTEICVPSRALTELPREEQEAMLAHELAHLVRRDPLWTTIACWVENGRGRVLAAHWDRPSRTRRGSARVRPWG